MSIENHPNINAAGLAAEIVVAFKKYLRGEAGKHDCEALDFVQEDIVEFVTKISEDLDQRFGT